MSCATKCDHISDISHPKGVAAIESRELGTGLTAVLTKVVTTDNKQIMYHYPITCRRLTDSVSLTEMEVNFLMGTAQTHKTGNPHVHSYRASGRLYAECLPLLHTGGCIACRHAR